MFEAVLRSIVRLAKLPFLSTFHTLPVVAFGLGLEVEPDLRLEPGEVFFDDPPYDPDNDRMPR